MKLNKLIVLKSVDYRINVRYNISTLLWGNNVRIHRGVDMLTDAELKMLDEPDGMDFIVFCLERLCTEKSVPAIWREYQEQAAQFHAL